MSERDPLDVYESPPWTVHRLLEACDLPGGLWLEPSAGSGAIIKAVGEKRSDVIWHAVEYRAECLPQLDVIPTVNVAVPGNFLAVPADARYAVVLGNPPYKSALRFVQHAMKFAPIVVMLLRLNWLASEERSAWMRAHTPSAFVLPDRPSFTGDGGDMTEYAWLAWGLPEAPTVHMLATTPLAERRGVERSARERGQQTLFGDAA